LTSKLSGWQVDIIAEEVTKLGFDEKVTQAIEALALIEGISREQADALVHGGLTTLEDLLQAEEEDLSEIEAIGSESGAVLAAARAEAARRTLKVGETSVA
jgi:predicted RecB family nuclease